MVSRVSEQTIDAWSLIAEYEQTALPSGQFGACASFIGSMRDFSTHENLSKMVLEHYPDMTTRYLDKLEQLARHKWHLNDCLIVHRVGNIFPADAIVVIACWSAHRRAALDACNWLIEELKHKAPFWKQEFGPEGAHWVTTNTDGHSQGSSS